MTRTPGPTGRALACQARGASPSRPCPQGTQPPAPEASRPWPHQVSSRVSRLASEGVAFRAQDPPVLALSCALPSRVRELGAGPQPACSVGTRPWVQPKSGAGVAAGATAQLRGAALLWPPAAQERPPAKPGLTTLQRVSRLLSTALKARDPWEGLRFQESPCGHTFNDSSPSPGAPSIRSHQLEQDLHLGRWSPQLCSHVVKEFQS